MSHMGPRGVVYVLGGLFALALACDLLWMPIQVSDSLGEIEQAQQSESPWVSFTDSLGTAAYLRPFRITQIKILFDLAGGQHYWLVFRGFHALLLVVAVWLFLRALPISTSLDFAAATFAMVVLIGLHTFRGTLQEAFPINHFLEVVVACLLTINLARSGGGLGVDIVAAMTFIAAALTLESGLLVWVVAIAAWAVGWRGISARGIALMTMCLAAYLYLRFGYFSTGVPGLTERSSGYLLEMLEVEELQQRFSAQPQWFYGYNVIASAASVLFAEPQAGVFEAVGGWLNNQPIVRFLLPVISSVLTTALMAWVAFRRARLGVFDDATRFLLVFVAVLAANAVMSFAYTKDEIMSPAGAFYALAAFGAVRHALVIVEDWRPLARVAGLLLLCTLATLWTVRSLGVHYKLRSQAAKHQVDWAVLPYVWQRQERWPNDPEAQHLILQLRRAAIGMRVPNTRFGKPEWPSRLWPD
jgi:hypothetical protein